MISDYFIIGLFTSDLNLTILILIDSNHLKKITLVCSPRAFIQQLPSPCKMVSDAIKYTINRRWSEKMSILRGRHKMYPYSGKQPSEWDVEPILYLRNIFKKKLVCCFDASMKRRQLRMFDWMFDRQLLRMSTTSKVRILSTSNFSYFENCLLHS